MAIFAGRERDRAGLGHSGIVDVRSACRYPPIRICRTRCPALVEWPPNRSVSASGKMPQGVDACVLRQSVAAWQCLMMIDDSCGRIGSLALAIERKAGQLPRNEHRGHALAGRAVR